MYMLTRSFLFAGSLLLLARSVSAQAIALRDDLLRGSEHDSLLHIQQRTELGNAEHRIALDFRGSPLKEALRIIAEKTGTMLVYSDAYIPKDHRVALTVTNATVTQALGAVLRGTGLVWRTTTNGVVIEPRGHSVVSTAPQRAMGTVHGRVTDSVTGAPIDGVVVTVIGTRLGTMTDASGHYSITSVPPGQHDIRARRVGYTEGVVSTMVSEGETTKVDFALRAMPSRLAEFVTTATGQQQRLQVANAIAAIHADSVAAQMPVTSLSDVINARASGVQIVLSNGMTGTSPRIRIRGLNSLTTSNDPLLVIDGVRIESSAGAGNGFSTSSATSGRLNDLDPEEIESIEIVKGPSAATLYGTDAANGVIIVKTKHGQTGRASWAAHAQVGTVTEPGGFLGNYYSWGRNATTGAIQQCVLVQAAAGKCTIDSLTTFSPLTNAETSPLGTGNRQQYGLQLSGSNAQFRYFLLGDYEGETGPLRMPDAEQARIAPERGGQGVPSDQIHPNALHKVNVRGNSSIGLGSTGELAISSGFISSRARIPDFTIFYSGALGPGYRDANDGWGRGRPAELFGIESEDHVQHFINSISGTWQPRGWLVAHGTVGADFSSAFLDQLQRRGEGPFGAGRNGRRFNSRTDVTLYTADLGLSATAHPTSEISLRTSTGIQYNRRTLQATTATGLNLPPGSETLAGAATITNAEQTDQSIVAGAYVEEVVGIRERLFLTGALRADGASGFGRDFRTATYPKASASWLVVDDGQKGLNSLRLRLAYGQAGVQPSATAALPLIAAFPAFVDGVATSGGHISAVGNPDLKPERQSEVEVGADAEALARRVKMEITYYHRVSHDALINRPLPTEFGVPARQENLGSVLNWGWEGSLTARLIDARNLAWDVTLTGAVERNRLLRIGAGIPFIGAPSSRSQEGYPLYSMFDRPILGFSDANGNGIIEASEIQLGDSLVYAGQRLPTSQLAASTTVGLLNNRLRVSTLFEYRGGFTVPNFLGINRCFSGICRAVNDPRASLSRQARAVALTSAFDFYGYYETTSFIRWRELAVSYDLPTTMTRVMGATHASVSLTARNLALFSSYSGVDPEVNTLPSAGSEGYYDSGQAPPARYWLLRLNVTY